MIEKGLQVVDPDRDRQETVQQQEYKFKGSQRRIPGLKLWSYNPSTEEVKEVPVERKLAVKYDGSMKKTSKAEYTEGLIYLQALNLKTAHKKAMKWKVASMARFKQQIAEELKRREAVDGTGT